MQGARDAEPRPGGGDGNRHSDRNRDRTRWFGFGSQMVQMGSFGPMLSGQFMNSAQGSQVLQHMQQQMVDRFPQVVPAGLSAGVLYVVDGDAEVRADIQFADEVGALWRRPFGESPEPVLEER